MTIRKHTNVFFCSAEQSIGTECSNYTFPKTQISRKMGALRNPLPTVCYLSCCLGKKVELGEKVFYLIYIQLGRRINK